MHRGSQNQCELKTASNTPGRRFAALLTEDDCKNLATSDNTLFQYILYTVWKLKKSVSTSTGSECTQNTVLLIQGDFHLINWRRLISFE